MLKKSAVCYSDVRTCRCQTSLSSPSLSLALSCPITRHIKTCPICRGMATGMAKASDQTPEHLSPFDHNNADQPTSNVGIRFKSNKQETDQNTMCSVVVRRLHLSKRNKVSLTIWFRKIHRNSSAFTSSGYTTLAQLATWNSNTNIWSEYKQ